jgi:EAL domain-containing protein (putative c-di-GMP-specific phosphodiesterase class I)
VIEITESALLEDSPAIVERLAELRALGVRLALDDFGTGYSSLAYLRRFPVDTLKVDRSFVATVARTEGDAAIVGAVLGLAVGMGIDVVAEGIEEVAQLERLREMGCRLGQGYLLGRPGSAEDADALVASGGSIPVAAQASASVS